MTPAIATFSPVPRGIAALYLTATSEQSFLMSSWHRLVTRYSPQPPRTTQPKIYSFALPSSLSSSSNNVSNLSLNTSTNSGSILDISMLGVLNNAFRDPVTPNKNSSSRALTVAVRLRKSAANLNFSALLLLLLCGDGMGNVPERIWRSRFPIEDTPQVWGVGFWCVGYWPWMLLLFCVDTGRCWTLPRSARSML